MIDSMMNLTKKEDGALTVEREKKLINRFIQ